MEREGAAKLKRLDLSSNILKDEGVEDLSRVLTSEHQEIDYLKLAANENGWQGALHLAEAISSLACHVTELNLACNSVGNQGIVALAAALAIHESMQSMELSANKVGDIGVEALSYAWTTTEKRSLHLLSTLDLSDNDITLLGAAKLFGVDFDKLAPNLTSLSLSSNQIAHAGIERIAHGLPSCKLLQSLCLETQQPLNTISSANHHQLFVRNEI